MAEKKEISPQKVAAELKEIAAKVSELADRVLEQNPANKTWPAPQS